MLFNRISIDYFWIKLIQGSFWLFLQFKYFNWRVFNLYNAKPKLAIIKFSPNSAIFDHINNLTNDKKTDLLKEEGVKFE